MKKLLLFITMAAALLFTQCKKDDKNSMPSEGKTVSMTVTAGPGSKTNITPTGAITWSKDDKLYVGYEGEYIGYLTLMTGGESSATGVFTGNVDLPTSVKDGDKPTFHFFYLGSEDYTNLEKGATTVYFNFSSQNIYKNGNKLENASAQHVGYGSAKGTVKDGMVTDINVMMVSKVALARFNFTESDSKDAYEGKLTLSGDNIYNKMTVGFDGTFEGTSGSTTDGITLAGGHGERYVMLVPTSETTETSTFTGENVSGSDKETFKNGIKANQFYHGENDKPIEVALKAAVPTHECVDLGLSVKWATCNVGASKPEEYGDYYAWGETEPYYQNDAWCDHPSHNSNIIFDENIGYGWKNYLDGKSTSWNASLDWKPYDDNNNKTLTSDYDAASANWGGDWRMPTKTEWDELYSNTIQEETTVNGVNGYKFTSTKEDYTSESIFLPAAGCRDGKDVLTAGSDGRYWSSSLVSSNIRRAYDMLFNSDKVNQQDYGNRYLGFSVRPVCKPQK